MKHLLVAFFAAGLFMTKSLYAQLPEGFEQTEITNEIYMVVTVDFADNGYVYAADYYGRIWLIIDDELQPEPVIDISDEVNGDAELGCLGFALDPNFMLNGYVYMLYIVDRHHLDYFGTPQYDPNANDYGKATIGRVSRFQLQISDYQTMIPDSRTVLFGEHIGEGNPSLTVSHGTGDLLFGSDGSLIFSTGDGNTWVNYFSGGSDPIPDFSFDEQGLADGIISPAENVGSFRAQLLQSYSGKVLRIDPSTGEGLASNPYYDPENPSAAESKVWALGLRNPYRMTLKPGTGSDNIADGDPGTIYVSDVGYNQWEEINVCDGPGYNFGWPLYEGLEKSPGYYQKIRKNLHQPNPYHSEGCAFDFFTFQQLVRQENASHEHFYPNPCNPASNIADYADVFEVTNPAFTYRNGVHGDNLGPYIPGFAEDGTTTGVNITSPEAGVEQAEYFDGISAMVGDFYSGTSYPEDYHNILPVLDYSGWLKVFWFDDNHELTKMEHWMSDLVNVVDMKYNPHNECYYMIGLAPSQISRLCFVGNRKPVIDATATPPYGPSPLSVDFDATQTYDPDGDPLTYSWDFGDGNLGTGEVVTHVYNAPSSEPISYTAVLTVMDTANNQSTKTFIISPNNTPPSVEITSIDDGMLYSKATAQQHPLEADVYDAEHPNSALTFDWRTYLHHNTHFHPYGESSEELFNIVTSPIGCGPIDSYYYRITLRVTDPNGLQGYDEVSIFPDCEGELPIPDDIPTIESFMLYPNPASQLITLHFGNITSTTEYQTLVFDLSGRLLNESTFVLDENLPMISLPVSGLAAGQYIIKIKGQEEEFTSRFVVVKP